MISYIFCFDATELYLTALTKKFNWALNDLGTGNFLFPKKKPKQHSTERNMNTVT